jgi:SAM-dependent methyltransferase
VRESQSRRGVWTKRVAYRIGAICFHFGFDLRRLVWSVNGIPTFLRDIRTYSQAKLTRPTFGLKLLDLWPILYEKRETAGGTRQHYFQQDLWAARRIFRQRPQHHVDIGSRIDGFIAHLLTFMPVTVIDIRAINSTVEGLRFIRDDATALKGFEDNSIDSLSCLHAAEHFGLGRYGDPIDPNGCFKLMKSLQRVLRPGGRLYFSVPIGRERVEFNAHRVFAVPTIVDSLNEMALVSFSFVDDTGEFHEDVNWKETPACEHGCGLFEFTKAPVGND